MATTEELNAYMRAHEKEIKDGLKFIGVFASNELPSYNISELDSGFCFIANYDPSFKSGSHWVGFRVGRARQTRNKYPINNRTVYYFDSYGENLDADNVVLGDKTRFRKFVEAIPHNQFLFNNKDYQALYSDVCGLYSCYFLLHGLPTENTTAWAGFVGYPKAKLATGGAIVNNPAAEQNDDRIRRLVPIEILRSAGKMSQAVEEKASLTIFPELMNNNSTSSSSESGQGISKPIQIEHKGPSAIIQAYRFDKATWPVSKAWDWLKSRNIKPIKSVDITENQLRYRMVEPKLFSRFWYEDIKDSPGVSVIMGIPK
jgi:hypothetical protein